MSGSIFDKAFPPEARRKIAETRVFNKQEGETNSTYVCEDGLCIVGALFKEAYPGIFDEHGEDLYTPGDEFAFEVLTTDAGVVFKEDGNEAAVAADIIRHLIFMNDRGLLKSHEDVRYVLEVVD